MLQRRLFQTKIRHTATGWPTIESMGRSETNPICIAFGQLVPRVRRIRGSICLCRRRITAAGLGGGVAVYEFEAVGGIVDAKILISRSMVNPAPVKTTCRWPIFFPAAIRSGVPAKIAGFRTPQKLVGEYRSRSCEKPE